MGNSENREIDLSIEVIGQGGNTARTRNLWDFMVERNSSDPPITIAETLQDLLENAQRTGVFTALHHLYGRSGEVGGLIDWLVLVKKTDADKRLTDPYANTLSLMDEYALKTKAAHQAQGILHLNNNEESDSFQLRWLEHLQHPGSSLTYIVYHFSPDQKLRLSERHSHALKAPVEEI